LRISTVDGMSSAAEDFWVIVSSAIRQPLYFLAKIIRNISVLPNVTAVLIELNSLRAINRKNMEYKVKSANAGAYHRYKLRAIGPQFIIALIWTTFYLECLFIYLRSTRITFRHLIKSSWPSAWLRVSWSFLLPAASLRRSSNKPWDSTTGHGQSSSHNQY